ncbi:MULTISPECIES: DNA alkylation repair protein [unclassified Paenibacillus]|uniref:DNA alkylation repair protein n=1 Tax=unclassified Paenibacillus TaxID=185978 RepID=UPI0004134543|nr:MULTISPECIES: DNA alkylation repair protein [unclassified Paenibacillus]KGP79038.1 DNA alkylation repair protein [Paenibacillus sp. MAEPY2]KGP88215.1 DNA alkylation repair protein [Paenibacillus sp. MAEPY1]
METVVRTQLLSLVEPEYQKFSAALIPNITNLLGVRLPEIRKMAKQIVKEDWRAYLKTADDDYFEEVMLQAMVIGHAQADIEELLHHIAWFVPKIDNWSVCDSFCGGLKYTKAHLDQVWQFLQPYLVSNQEYDIRFGVVMLLNFYMEEKYISEVLISLDRIRHDGYYVKMAVAWAISIAYVKQPEATLRYLQDNSLDDFTYNKALQKITESYRVDSETKQIIRSMKRKSKKPVRV